MVNWPDLILPPINLWSLPKQQKDYDMQITLSDTNGEFSIYLKEDFKTLDEYVELLIKPVLRAAGFQEDSLDKYFVKEGVEYYNWELEPIEKKATDTFAKKYYE